jgi:tripartite-type tricarboxylate transporter receptor subunit TctC
MINRANPRRGATAAVAVPGYQAAGWVTIVAPANTPKPIVNRLHSELKAIVGSPDIQSQLIKLGTIPADSPSPEEQQRFINAEIVRWAEVVQRAGIAGSE